jgi:hypothetical protein
MKWDYLVVKVHQDIESTELGFMTLGYEGWELVSVDSGIAYFKRPKFELKPPELKPEDKQAIEGYFGGKIA